MANTQSLIERIDAEFAASGEKTRDLQAQQLHKYHERKKRQAIAENHLGELREDWQLRLAALLDRFPAPVAVTAEFMPGGWVDTLKVQTELARVQLKFSASTDMDVCKGFLDYDLEVLPVFMRFAPRSRLEVTPGALDREATGSWMDDRLIDFVRVFLSLQENAQYLSDHLVEDPIALVRFPKHSAAATLARNGQTFYFIAEETRREFENQLHEAPRSDRPSASFTTGNVPGLSTLVL
jgi:YHS domain-containing protein